MKKSAAKLAVVTGLTIGAVFAGSTSADAQGHGGRRMVHYHRHCERVYHGRWHGYWRCYLPYWPGWYGGGGGGGD